MRRDIFFQGVSAPLRLDDAEAVLPLLQEIALDWRFRIASAGDLPPFFSITGRRGTTMLRCASHIEDRPPQDWDPLNALCDAMAGLAVALPLSDARLICLHAAGVDFAGRLAIFPNTRRAGKSTLSVALAKAGHRVFSDDVVPLSFPHGGAPTAHAMGTALRLRLPLPESLPADFRDWAEAVPGPRNRQYHYLPLNGQPVHGERLPVGAFVLLDRRDQPSPAQLDPVSPDMAMDALLHQNFTRDRHSGDILQCIARLLTDRPAYRLTYSDLGSAVRCLEQAFADWPDTAPPVESAPGQVFRKADFAGPIPLRKADLACFPSHRPGCLAVSIGDKFYLADPEGRAIHRTDALAAAIWDLIGEHLSGTEILDLLATEFPQTDRARIAADLQILLDDLQASGLISV